MLYADRVEAGQALASAMATPRFSFDESWTVVGIARGGVPIGRQIADRWGLPLRALCIDDVRTPSGQLFISATGHGFRFPNRQVQRPTFTSPKLVEDAETRWSSVTELSGMAQRLAERQNNYNGESQPCFGKKVILTDDGCVSGKTAFTAIAQLRHVHSVEQIVLATPVIPKWMASRYTHFRVAYVRRSILPRPTTGMYYDSFEDVPDEEVRTACNNTDSLRG